MFRIPQIARAGQWLDFVGPWKRRWMYQVPPDAAPGRVVYIDIDMKLHKSPLLFTETNGHYDFMAFNWNSEPRVSSDFDWLTMETSGGIFYFILVLV